MNNLRQAFPENPIVFSPLSSGPVILRSLQVQGVVPFDFALAAVSGRRSVPTRVSLPITYFGTRQPIDYSGSGRVLMVLDDQVGSGNTVRPIAREIKRRHGDREVVCG